METSYLHACRSLPLLHHAIYMFCKISFLGSPPPPQPRSKRRKAPLWVISNWALLVQCGLRGGCFIDFSDCFSSFLFEKTLSPTAMRQENCAWSWSGVKGQQAAPCDSGVRNVQPDPAPAVGTVLPQHHSLFSIHHSGVTFVNWSSSCGMLQSRNGSQGFPSVIVQWVEQIEEALGLGSLLVRFTLPSQNKWWLVKAADVFVGKDTIRPAISTGNSWSHQCFVAPDGYPGLSYLPVSLTETSATLVSPDSLAQLCKITQV